MTDKTIDLDRHRGMAAQKATGLRRLLAEVEANERASRLRQDELESHLIARLPRTGMKLPRRRAICLTSFPIAWPHKIPGDRN
jgi:hypothetical protein